MTSLQAIILSVVEGITEFLPVSSTGHLILTSHLLGISQTPFVTSFEIVIQSGAIGAVIFLYIAKIIHKPAIITPLCIAFIPAALVGFVFYTFIKNVLFQNMWITVATLGIGGIILIILEQFFLRKKHPDLPLESITPKQSLVIGLFQSLAIIPGVSRAGATIVGGMLAGLPRETAVEFSFLLAVPTILAATFLDLATSSYQFHTQELALLSLGFVGSFLSALIAVRVFLVYVKKNSLTLFGVYRILLALLFILFVKN